MRPEPIAWLDSLSRRRPMPHARCPRVLAQTDLRYGGTERKDWTARMILAMLASHSQHSTCSISVGRRT
ncbi:hypothetical protein MESS2_1070032 [Mesorhizobium metallidurans STM 2683]|uniref:Uncharacterized protein n=1 Tax=Mesorhizobium metallidurans STM 2683 TaxID=1297569 RepID=M5EH86_9HYPH|nr:hypothetical protein MESS2_1070032 [Mesorhizobium metallidurans STM 2683]